MKRAELIHGMLAGFGLVENLPVIRKRGHLDLQSQLNPGFWKRQFFTLRRVRPGACLPFTYSPWSLTAVVGRAVLLAGPLGGPCHAAGPSRKPLTCFFFSSVCL